LMIGDKTLPEFLFQWLVMFQPMIWIILYNTDIKIAHQQERTLKYLFAVTMEGIFLAVVGKRISIGFYTTTILAQYIFLIVVSFYLYTQRKPVIQSICLAFLTVFLNSLYWELPLHVLEIIQVGFHSGQIVQFWRLLPLAFFLKRFKFNQEQVRLVIMGEILAVLLIMLRYTMRPQGNYLIFFFARFICMTVLTKAVIEAEPITP